MGQNFIFGAKTSPIRPFQMGKKFSFDLLELGKVDLSFGGGWGVRVDHTGGFTRSYMGIQEVERGGSGQNEV